jgi:hypothetical protein
VRWRRPRGSDPHGDAGRLDRVGISHADGGGDRDDTERNTDPSGGGDGEHG